MIEELKTKLNQAMRERDEVTVRTLRMLSAALTNAKIARGQALTPDEEISVVKKEAKSRRDSIESYRTGKREDLASKEEEELAVLQQFLPATATPDQVASAVGSAITATGADAMAQMGQVIGLAIKELGPGADGAAVAQEAKRQLSAG